MICAGDWLDHARRLVVEASASGGRSAQIELRRAVSAAYYGLFHCLTSSGSTAFAAGGPALCFQTARAFSHGPMRKVCDAYVRSPTRPFAAELGHLNTPPPSPELIRVAFAFQKLQESRQAADYDREAVFTVEDALLRVQQAEAAAHDLHMVKALPATIVFLTALLLADRWTRRG